MISRRRFGWFALALGLLLAGGGACERQDRPVAPIDPCADQACGAPCTLCIADAATCPERPHACNARGECVPMPVVCDYNPCTGKLCGEPCTICSPDDPQCVETAVLKQCTAAGQCVAAPVQCPRDAGTVELAPPARQPAP